MLKKGDIILFIFIIIISGLGYLGYSAYTNRVNNLPKVAVVKHEDRIIGEYNLETVIEPEEFEVSGAYTNKILVEKGRIRVLESDCPDQVCVNTGWLDKSGELAVCVPNRLIIKIKGDSGETDSVTY